MLKPQRNRIKLSATAWIVGVFCAVLIVSFVTNPGLSGGWYWDLGNGLGFAALASLICLAVITPKLGGLRSHQWISYSAAVYILLHALWFLLGDRITLQYILPGAPAAMWAGILALLLVVFLIVIALPSFRYRAHRHHTAFRQWHLWLSIIIVAATLYHVIGSGFYIRSWVQFLLLLAVVLAGYLGRYIGAAYVDEAVAKYLKPTPVFIVVSLFCFVFFAAARNISL